MPVTLVDALPIAGRCHWYIRDRNGEGYGGEIVWTGGSYQFLAAEQVTYSADTLREIAAMVDECNRVSR